MNEHLRKILQWRGTSHTTQGGGDCSCNWTSLQEFLMAVSFSCLKKDLPSNSRSEVGMLPMTAFSLIPFINNSLANEAGHACRQQIQGNI